MPQISTAVDKHAELLHHSAQSIDLPIIRCCLSAIWATSSEFHTLFRSRRHLLPRTTRGLRATGKPRRRPADIRCRTPETAALRALEDAKEIWNVELYADGVVDEKLEESCCVTRRRGAGARSSLARSPTRLGGNQPRRTQLVHAGRRSTVHGAHDRDKAVLARIWIEIGGRPAVRHRLSRYDALLPSHLTGRCARAARHHVLDVGTGTACSPSPPRGCFIAALVATDTDNVAVPVARDNTLLNHVVPLFNAIYAPGGFDAREGIRRHAPYRRPDPSPISCRPTETDGKTDGEPDGATWGGRDPVGLLSRDHANAVNFRELKQGWSRNGAPTSTGQEDFTRWGGRRSHLARAAALLPSPPPSHQIAAMTQTPIQTGEDTTITARPSRAGQAPPCGPALGAVTSLVSCRSVTPIVTKTNMSRRAMSRRALTGPPVPPAWRSCTGGQSGVKPGRWGCHAARR